jgi:hypothetical protein
MHLRGGRASPQLELTAKLEASWKLVSRTTAQSALYNPKEGTKWPALPAMVVRSESLSGGRRWRRR